MPDSLATQLISNVWDDVSSAVNTGLAIKTALSSVFPVVTKNLADTTWSQRLRTPGPGGGDSLVRRSAGPMAAFDCVYRRHLGYDDLRSPDLDDLTAWGAAVRKFELACVVKYLAAKAAPHTCTADYKSLSAAQPQGWGPVRCVAFAPDPGATPVPGDLAFVDWEGPVKVDIASADIGGIEALVFRLGGGPYIKRPADLALGWLPAADGGMDGVLTVDVVLVGQLELVNVTADTITAITME